MRIIACGLISILVVSTPVIACDDVPDKFDKDTARSLEHEAELFAGRGNYGSKKFERWPERRVALMPDGSCFQLRSVFSGNKTRGTLAINNHLSGINRFDVPVGTLYDMSVVTVRLNKKLDPSREGSFQIRLNRNKVRGKSGKECRWYTGSRRQKHYKPGTAHRPDRVQNISSWNNAHDEDASLRSNRFRLGGNFHASSSPGHNSTWSKRENFRFSENLTKYYDVEVYVKLMCFENTGSDDSKAGMINFSFRSGNAGAFVYYFSAASDVQGTVRFCDKNECNSVRKLKLGPRFKSQITRLLALFRIG